MGNSLIPESFWERRFFAPERATPDEGVRLEHQALAAGHITDGLRRELEAIHAEQVGVGPGQTVESRWTEAQLRSHAIERLRWGRESVREHFEITIPGGSRVFGPPYDVEWQEGGGSAFGSRADGTLITVSTPGFSAAGVGFYLTAPEPYLAAVIPQGGYEWSWASFADLPWLRSRGGVGIAVYVDGEPQPAVSRQAQLWSLSGVSVFSGGQGSGRIADAASPAFGFGPVPLAPILIHMTPGRRYLVWVWCWQVTPAEAASGFIAFLQAKMPLVTVDAGPPLVIR
ncbi:MAG TPA: hypothetical protein VF017_11365 [Thermoanaerobaculia bacterium]|nr:hypothetical protein [Thermoanaerobaculia bacterium]